MEAETASLRAAEIGPVGREGTGSARVGLSLLRYSGVWVAGYAAPPSVDTLRYTTLMSPGTHLKKSLNYQGHGDGCEFFNI